LKIVLVCLFNNKKEACKIKKHRMSSSGKHVKIVSLELEVKPYLLMVL
jgi:hypothetical protein